MHHPAVPNSQTILSDDEFQALTVYKDQHGRQWKDRLVQAWLNDWREQWGILRTVRNTHGIQEALAAFDKRVQAGKAAAKVAA
jgi:hypothetical protein